METIRNYLETMFRSMPSTPEVLRAKDELWQMMEDKYTELMEEGKSENEAVGTVIAEFGNLDELAEVLGINEFMGAPEGTMNEQRRITLEDAKDFLQDKKMKGVMIALGVMFCIASPTGCIIGEAVHINELYGVTALFVAIALAVGLFISSGTLLGSKWDFLKNEVCALDFEACDYVQEKKDSYHVVFAMFLVIGIGLCILSVVPPVILSSVSFDPKLIDFEAMGGAGFLFFVAMGVFFIVLGSIVKGSFDTLLKVNDEK